MEVEDEIQLADVAKVTVEHFNVVMDDLERGELVVGGVHTDQKVQACIAEERASQSCHRKRTTNEGDPQER